MDCVEDDIKGMRRSGSDPLKLISFSAIKGHSVTLMSSPTLLLYSINI